MAVAVAEVEDLQMRPSSRKLSQLVIIDQNTVHVREADLPEGMERLEVGDISEFQGKDLRADTPGLAAGYGEMLKDFGGVATTLGYYL